MKKILILIFLLSLPCIYAQEETSFVPDLEVGDRWIIRREISEFANLGSNSSRIQHWKYEVVNKVSMDGHDYFTILIISEEKETSIKLIIRKDKFVLKEIVEITRKVQVSVRIEEVSSPMLEKRKNARLYDLPAFPIVDPNFATKGFAITPDGRKLNRTRKSYRRHHYSRGDVVVTELIWQEVSRINADDIKKYKKLSSDHLNKVKSDGYYIVLNGEDRRVKQIWTNDIPWWIYNESIYEKDYLVDFYPVSDK